MSQALHRLLPLASLSLAGLAGAADLPERGIHVVASQSMTGVALKLQMQAVRQGTSRLFVAGEDLPQLPVGSHVKICVTATATGYITLWSIDSQGAHVRIYPNERAYLGRRGAPIQQDVPVCVGEGTDFALAIDEPLGLSKVYVHWTPTEEAQLDPSTYPELGQAPRSGNPPGQYASQTLEYVITR
jgi:hypothetical protein